MDWARREREALSDLLLEVGPDAPTLPEGWMTRDLAAHLVMRDRRPDAVLGMYLTQFAAHTERVQAEILAQPWDAVVGLVRTGPPPWSPAAFEPIDRLVNTVEYFVHHEDVRRARDGWEPRPLDGDLETELWRRLKLGARVLIRNAPVGLVLRRTNGDEIRAHPAKDDQPEVVVTGAASELALFAYGRQDHARVTIDAPDNVAEALNHCRLGF
jgi:uncharacterized protein (TIGR03085 family)